MTPTVFNNIDEYIDSFPESVQSRLREVRSTIHHTVPEAIETINYGIPTFKLDGKNLVHFAAFKNHIGFYPTPNGMESFKQELSNFKQGKGSVQFPLDTPLPLTLIQKITQFRVAKIRKQPSK